MSMRVVSVNAGTSRSVEIRGRVVETGIFKSPVEGPRWIDENGVRGDTRVAPRKLGELHHAVHLYPHEHYAHWERVLGRASIPLGQFGENLTATGVLETNVRVGDIFRVGTALLQVACPRIPCRKLDYRMESSGFKRTFLASRRVGYYLRVLRPGEVAAGDAITLVESDAASPTLDEFTRTSQFDYWDEQGLRSLLDARGLSLEWREVLHDKLERARNASGWFGSRELEIVGTTGEGGGMLSFDLRCARGRPLAPFLPGQDLTVTLRPAQSRVSERRSLPLTSDPEDLSGYRAAARCREGDPLGEYLRGLGEGDVFRALAPSGSFTLDVLSKPCRRLVLISRGFGLAYFIGMLRGLSRQASTPRLAAAVFHDHRRAVPGLSVEAERMAAASRDIEWHDDGLLELSETDLREDTHVFAAGPALFVEACERRLLELNVDRARIQLKRTA